MHFRKDPDFKPVLMQMQELLIKKKVCSMTQNSYPKSLRQFTRPGSLRGL